MGWAKWNDGRALGTSKGNKGLVYAYPKGATEKVNSIYVMKYPSYESGVELGWFSDVGTNPTAFRVDVINGEYHEVDMTTVPVDAFTTYAIKNVAGTF